MPLRGNSIRDKAWENGGLKKSGKKKTKVQGQIVSGAKLGKLWMSDKQKESFLGTSSVW